MSGFKNPDSWEFLGIRKATQDDVAFLDMLASHVTTGTVELPTIKIGEDIAEFATQGASTRTLTRSEIQAYFKTASANNPDKAHQIHALKQAAEALNLTL